MTPVGQVYRPEGRLDARSILSATILGVVTAVFAAVVVWAWELSPIPTLVILTPLAQGFVIGFVLALLIGRLKLRHPRLMATVGLVCGLASVGLIHYGHYLHFLDEVADQYKQVIEADDELPAEKKQEILANLSKGASDLGDVVLLDKTGHRGFLGSLIFRADQGIKIKNSDLTGWGVYILWACEAVAVAAVASVMAHSRAAMPYCEDCGTWCSKATSPIALAGESAGDFTDAVRTDDPQTVARLFEQPIDAETIGQHGIRAALHSCEACDQTFADVESYQVKIKKGKPETTTTALLKQVRVSPAMTSLLRGPVVVPGVSERSEGGEEAEHHVIDEPAALEARDL